MKKLNVTVSEGVESELIVLPWDGKERCRNTIPPRSVSRRRRLHRHLEV